MKRNREIVYPLAEGMDQYSPDISSQELPLVELSNAVVRKRRLDTLRKHSQIGQVGTSPVLGFIHSFEPTTASSAFYALADNEIFRYDAFTDEWFPTPIDQFSATGQPFASVQWEDRAYITRPGYPLSKLDYHQSVEVDTSWRVGTQPLSARYALVANNHLMLANVQEGQSHYRTRLQWSDLYRPEQWRIRTDTEADLFDVDVGTAEITGITMQRGYLIIYTQNSIWRGTYRGLPQVYFFEPVINGLGNIFHYSVVQVKEVDFFVGRDNFYVQDGLQPRAIGDPVWAFFKRTAVTTTAGSQLRGFADEDNNEVFWQYERTGVSLGQESDERWELVYNYKEQQWSTRSAQGSQCYYFPFRDIKTYQVIDEFKEKAAEYGAGFEGLFTEGSGTTLNNELSELPFQMHYLGSDPYEWIQNDDPQARGPYAVDLRVAGYTRGFLGSEGETPFHSPLDSLSFEARYKTPTNGDQLFYVLSQVRFLTESRTLYITYRTVDDIAHLWLYVVVSGSLIRNHSLMSGPEVDKLTDGNWHTVTCFVSDITDEVSVGINGIWSAPATTTPSLLDFRVRPRFASTAPGTTLKMNYLKVVPSPELITTNEYLIDGGEYSDELIDGDFQYTNVPQQPWVGGLEGQVFTQSSDRTLPDGSAAHGFFETFEVFFDSTFSSKELSRVKVSYKGKGSPNVELLIGTRSNQMEDVKWSSPIKPSGLGGVLADTTFDFRADAEGKYIRFKVRWANTAEDFISEFYSISPELTTPISHDTR